jgi:hypothetical protein
MIDASFMQMNDTLSASSDPQATLCVPQHCPAIDPGSFDLSQIVLGPPFGRKLLYRSVPRVQQ